MSCLHFFEGIQAMETTFMMTFVMPGSPDVIQVSKIMEVAFHRKMSPAHT